MPEEEMAVSLDGEMVPGCMRIYRGREESEPAVSL